jgi:hypothetical protein
MCTTVMYHYVCCEHNSFRWEWWKHVPSSLFEWRIMQWFEMCVQTGISGWILWRTYVCFKYTYCNWHFMYTYCNWNFITVAKMDSDFLTHRMVGILKCNENCFYSWAVSCSIPKMLCILGNNQGKSFISQSYYSIYINSRGL